MSTTSQVASTGTGSELPDELPDMSNGDMLRMQKQISKEQIYMTIQMNLEGGKIGNASKMTAR